MNINFETGKGRKGARLKIWRFISLLYLLCFHLLVIVPFASAKKRIVYIVPIEETVEKGLVCFFRTCLDTAEANDADLVIFEVNTPGGAVDAAGEIAKLMTDTPLKQLPMSIIGHCLQVPIFR